MNINKFYQSLKRCINNSDMYLKLLNHKGQELACITDIKISFGETKKEAIDNFGVEKDHDYYDENGKLVKACMVYHKYNGFRVIFTNFREDWI